MAELLLLILDTVKNKPDPQFRIFFLIYLPFVPHGDVTEA